MKNPYKITLYEFNSKKEVQSISVLLTIPITKRRCLAICKREVDGLRGKACFSAKIDSRRRKETKANV